MKLWRKRKIRAYEGVEYEPLTVLELLREMKDLSELATDLAYSALILDSDPIGEEVEELARRMDLLKYQLRLQAALSVRSKEEAEQIAGILQIADASEHIANAASDLVELLDANVSARPFLGHVLDEADDRIATLTVPDSSPIAGSTLGDLLVESRIGVRVLAIRRGHHWVYAPSRDNMFRPKDVALIRGQQEGADHLRRWLSGEETPGEVVATRVSPDETAAKPDRAKRAVEVEEILLDMKDTSELMVDLAYSAVFYGSRNLAREVHELEEEVGESLTDLHMLCLEAVKNDEMSTENALVIIRVAHAAEFIANSALEIADVVLRDVDLHPIIAETIRDSDSAVTKVTLGAGSKYLGQKLRELELESVTGMRILAVRRGSKWHSGVRGGFMLEAGDLLIAMGPEEGQEAFLRAADPSYEPE